MERTTMWQTPVVTNDSGRSLGHAYLSPYLSCLECNEIAFINSFAVGVAIAAGNDVESAHFKCRETMPKCTGCGRTHMWQVGAVDLTADMVEAAKAREEKKQRRLRSACLIQARVRGNIQRKVFAVDLMEHRRVQRIIYHAATLVAKRYRGYRGRRVADVERALACIKSVSSATLAGVLTSSQRRRVKRMMVPNTTASEPVVGLTQEPVTLDDEAEAKRLETERLAELAVERRKQRDAVHLFWYKRKQEVDLLYSNYQLLVERTGNRPPRFLVEKNLLIIAEKIREKQTVMAARIQSRIRGVFGRLVITKYRVEVAYVRRVRAASAFVIQRHFRRWRAKRERVTRFAAGRVRKITEAWKLARDEQVFREGEALAKERLLKAYQQERRLESTARMLGRVSFGACDGNRMLAFKQSGYGKHTAYKVCKNMLKLQSDRAETLRELDDQSDERHRQVESMCGANPALNVYFADEKNHRRERAVHLGSFHSSRALKEKTADLIQHNALRRAGRRAQDARGGDDTRSGQGVELANVRVETEPAKMPQLHARAQIGR